jgi:hypothetical protein
MLLLCQPLGIVHNDPMRKRKKNPAAVSLGKKGGRARTRQMTAAERTELASKAAKARWAKAKNK